MCAKRTEILRESDITERDARVHFFRFAARLTPQEASARLGDEEFVEAAEIPEKFHPTSQERTMDDAQLKWERDEAWRKQAFIEEWKEEWIKGWIVGWREGWREGRRQGKSIAAIQILQDSLGIPQTSVEDLAKRSLEELRELETELERQLASRD